jgi:hypothetical protein
VGDSSEGLDARVDGGFMALEFSREELLSDVAYQEPLFAGDVRCHGGFIDGRYVSPRTAARTPAIDAWKQRLGDAGHGLVSFPVALMPPHYPSYEQAKLLVLEGIQEPIVRSLTMIAIVEGFGAIIRDAPVPDWKRAVKEDVEGTALAHLDRGLYEAHARDEAGHREQGGHKQMWEAARDLAFRNPEIPSDVLLRMMTAGGGAPRRREPMFPTLAPKLEEMIAMLANVMVIEIFAEDVFSWGERLLGDPEISAEPEAAGTMVSHIRSDEKPHVEYLRTALSELRARTLLTRDGGEIPGQLVVDGLLERQLRGIASNRPRQQRETVRAELLDLIGEKRLATEVARRFESLDSGWTFPVGDEARIEIELV